MRNAETLTAYLDQCAEERRLRETGTLESLERLGELLRDNLSLNLYRAARRDGWTTADIEAAYRRRFGAT